jgi:3-(3-hydroxy-phenyl)propionate hydroxylase
MLKTYQYPEFEYVQSAEQAAGKTVRHPVVIVGGGPIGLTAALDFAQRGIRCVVLDDNNTVSIGSRAVCYAKRPLEIWDRLNCGDRMVAKGVSWKVGKVFFRDELSYQFDLLPEEHHKMPAMINLQQYYLEEYMIEEIGKSDLIDLRWKHKVISVSQGADFATLTVETPDGVFKMEADWVLACDGANSDMRKMVGAEFTGQFFQDRFLIADVVMKADFPTERWFWFDPPFHRNQSVLLHKQSDDVWRIDFQLGWDSDPTEEKKPENVIPRIKAMLGDDREFELEWVSIYQFRAACRIEKFTLWPRALRRRRRASGLALRRARRQYRRAGCGQPRLEAEASIHRTATQARQAACDLPITRRALSPPTTILAQLHARDRFHRAAIPGRAARYRDAALALARDHEFARPHGQFRPPLGADCPMCIPRSTRRTRTPSPAR